MSLDKRYFGALALLVLLLGTGFSPNVLTVWQPNASYTYVPATSYTAKISQTEDRPCFRTLDGVEIALGTLVKNVNHSIPVTLTPTDKNYILSFRCDNGGLSGNYTLARDVDHSVNITSLHLQPDLSAEFITQFYDNIGAYCNTSLNGVVYYSDNYTLSNYLYRLPRLTAPLPVGVNNLSISCVNPYAQTFGYNLSFLAGFSDVNISLFEYKADFEVVNGSVNFPLGETAEPLVLPLGVIRVASDDFAFCQKYENGQASFSLLPTPGTYKVEFGLNNYCDENGAWLNSKNKVYLGDIFVHDAEYFGFIVDPVKPEAYYNEVDSKFKVGANFYKALEIAYWVLIAGAVVWSAVASNNNWVVPLIVLGIGVIIRLIFAGVV